MEFIYEHGDPTTGRTEANAVYAHADGSTVVVETTPRGVVEEAFPASEQDDTCGNRWCEDGLMVWIEGEAERSQPCPDCAAGERVDADMEEAAIRHHESRLEEEPDDWLW